MCEKLSYNFAFKGHHWLPTSPVQWVKCDLVPVDQGTFSTSLRLFNRKKLLFVYIYTMGMSGLLDMYTRSLRVAGPRAEGVHIRQTTNAHGITVMCHIALPLAN